MNAPKSSLRLWNIAGLIVLLLIPVSLFVGFFSGPPVPTPPIPKGCVEIHVEFKGLSTYEFNQLTSLVRAMAEEHSSYVAGSTSERDVGDYNTYHGFWGNGFVDQMYKPNHPIPSPEIEAAMKTRLNGFLNGTDHHKVKLELRHGP